MNEHPSDNDRNTKNGRKTSESGILHGVTTITQELIGTRWCWRWRRRGEKAAMWERMRMGVESPKREVRPLYITRYHDGQVTAVGTNRRVTALYRAGRQVFLRTVCQWTHELK